MIDLINTPRTTGPWFVSLGSRIPLKRRKIYKILLNVPNSEQRRRIDNMTVNQTIDRKKQMERSRDSRDPKNFLLIAAIFLITDGQNTNFVAVASCQAVRWSSVRLVVAHSW